MGVMKLNTKNKVLSFIIVYLFSATLVFFLSNEIKQTVITTGVNIGFNDFLMITLKNSIASLWILSALLLGESILYIFFIINGVNLGLLISNFESLKYLILVIPHGIFEIASFVYICIVVIKWRNNKINNKKLFKNILISIIFLILSAAIETFITPKMIMFL